MRQVNLLRDDLGGWLKTGLPLSQYMLMLISSDRQKDTTVMTTLYSPTRWPPFAALSQSNEGPFCQHESD